MRSTPTITVRGVLAGKKLTMTNETLEQQVTDGSTAACEHHIMHAMADARTGDERDTVRRGRRSSDGLVNSLRTGR